MCVDVGPSIMCTHIHHWMLHVPSQVEVKGVNYTGTLESSQQSQTSVVVNQLDRNFTKGENHTVRVFATNSIGTSNPQSTLLRVPCELPNSNVESNKVLPFFNHCIHRLLSLSLSPFKQHTSSSQYHCCSH